MGILGAIKKGAAAYRKVNNAVKKTKKVASAAKEIVKDTKASINKQKAWMNSKENLEDFSKNYNTKTGKGSKKSKVKNALKKGAPLGASGAVGFGIGMKYESNKKKKSQPVAKQVVTRAKTASKKKQ
jgi:hypothetical protein